MNKYVSYLLKNKLITPSDTKSKNFFKDIFINNKYNVSRSNFVEFYTHDNEIIEGADELFLKLFPQIANYIAKFIFLNKDMFIIKLTEPDFFFISDNPVIIINPNTLDYTGILIWELDEAQVFMPLSPSYGISYCKKDNQTRLSQETLIHAALHNIESNIYSDRKDPEITNFFRTLPVF